LAWQCVDIGGSQTVELVSQVLELDKSHGVDEETTCKEDSSLKNYIRKKKNKKGRWVVAIDWGMCFLYVFGDVNMLWNQNVSFIIERKFKA